MIAKAIFFLKCLYYFRRTPNGMDRFFSDLLLSIDEFEPTKVLDYTATTNGGSHIYLQNETGQDLALNYSHGLGMNISFEVETKWSCLYSRATHLIDMNAFWVSEIKKLLALELKSKVRPLPVMQLKETK